MSSVVVDRRAIDTLPESVRKSRHRRFPIFGVALLGAAALAWYGQEWWTVGRFIESTDDAYVGGEITVIAPKVAGLIAEVAVADNQ
jgi:membrane fusion protein (multidrug efflux system)